MPGGPVLHCASIKLRVVGQWQMKARMLGFDELEIEELFPQDLQMKERWERVMLSNFQGERMKLRLYTTDLDAYIRVNNITFFVKQLWQSNPLPDSGGR